LRYVIKICYLTGQPKKFLWAQYHYLDNIVEDSGITSVRSNRQFDKLFKEIVALLELNGDYNNTVFSERTLKVFFKAYIELIFRTRSRMSQLPNEKSGPRQSLLPTQFLHYNQPTTRNSQSLTLLPPINCLLLLLFLLFLSPPKSLLRAPPISLLQPPTSLPRPTSVQLRYACTGASSAMSTTSLPL
jgi:hypothetical protein